MSKTSHPTTLPPPQAEVKASFTPVAVTRRRVAPLIGRARRAAAGRLVTFVLLCAAAAVILAPLWWMFATSVESIPEILTPPPRWVPSHWLWSNYVAMLTIFPFGTYLKNTLIYGVLYTGGTVASSAICAYSFARLRWPGRDVVFVLVLATMMIPFPATMVPLYLIFRAINWTNSLKPLIIPSITASPFFVFLLRQFFLTISLELTEAALIDGASHLRIFLQVIVPLSRPALITATVFSFVYAWNDFLGPLIYVTDPSRQTLAVGLQALSATGFHSVNTNTLMAAAMLTTLPMLIIFAGAQRYFVQGIAMTGFKG